MLKHTALIDDEVLILENGGEIPEVSLHGCLYYLSEDPEGPRITPSCHDLLRLKWAVVEGYRKIILRDLSLENRGQGHYRGLARSAVNWQRLSRFCNREGLDLSLLAAEVCEYLQCFLETEHEEVSRQGRATCINCSAPELLVFCDLIGFDPSRLPCGWEDIISFD